MDLLLKDKVIVITGAAGKPGSIGITITRTLLEEGAIPVMLDIDERGNVYEKTFKQEGASVLFLRVDVTNEIQVKNAVEAILHKYGRIDALVNNVGINDGVGLDGSLEDFVNSLNVNLISYWLMAKYTLKALQKSKGTILNIGSKVALTGQGGTSAYAASKGGVLALTREWATELLTSRIRVNAVLISESWTPGYEEWIESLENGADTLKSIKDKIPFEKRMTTPQEIANTVSFLISEKSSHTTGQFVFVDGGYVHLDRALINRPEKK